MERTQLFELVGELKLFGMKATCDEIMAAAGRLRKARREPPSCLVVISASMRPQRSRCGRLAARKPFVRRAVRADSRALPLGRAADGTEVGVRLFTMSNNPLRRKPIRVRERCPENPRHRSARATAADRPQHRTDYITTAVRFTG